MTRKQFTFIVVEAGTIISIMVFAYIFQEGFFGTASAAQNQFLPPRAESVIEDPRGFAKPARLSIPSIKVDAKVQHVGLTANGSMGIPSNFTDVAWYAPGTIPGEVGSAVMDGHVDNALGLKGVFKYLQNVKKGDEVIVTDARGREIRFRVINVQSYPYDAVPVEDIFHESERTLLHLITCGGKWVRSEKTYDTRVVVTAEYVSASPISTPATPASTTQ